MRHVFFGGSSHVTQNVRQLMIEEGPAARFGSFLGDYSLPGEGPCQTSVHQGELSL